MGLSIGSLHPAMGTKPEDMNGTGAVITGVSDDAKQKGIQIKDELTHILNFPVGAYPTKLIKLMIDGNHGKKDQSMQFKVNLP